MYMYICIRILRHVDKAASARALFSGRLEIYMYIYVYVYIIYINVCLYVCMYTYI
jgi:hypothetical protein